MWCGATLGIIWVSIFLLLFFVYLMFSTRPNRSAAEAGEIQHESRPMSSAWLKLHLVK